MMQNLPPWKHVMFVGKIDWLRMLEQRTLFQCGLLCTLVRISPEELSWLATASELVFINNQSFNTAIVIKTVLCKLAAKYEHKR